MVSPPLPGDVYGGLGIQHSLSEDPILGSMSDVSQTRGPLKTVGVLSAPLEDQPKVVHFERLAGFHAVLLAEGGA